MFKQFICAFIFLFFAASFSGCAIISLKPNKQVSVDRAPDYVEILDFYLFGLIGKQHLDISAICFNQRAELILNEYQPEDLAIGAKTLFFYMPKTVQIWCEH